MTFSASESVYRWMAATDSNQWIKLFPFTLIVWIFLREIILLFHIIVRSAWKLVFVHAASWVGHYVELTHISWWWWKIVTIIRVWGILLAISLFISESHCRTNLALFVLSNVDETTKAGIPPIETICFDWILGIVRTSFAISMCYQRWQMKWVDLWWRLVTRQLHAFRSPCLASPDHHAQLIIKPKF